MTEQAYIPPFPYYWSIAGGRLVAFTESAVGGEQEFILDYEELQFSAPPKLDQCNGQPCEHIRGHYHPKRLRFNDIYWIKISGLYDDLDTLPMDHAARSLRGMLHWRKSDKEPLYVLANGSVEPAALVISADSCMQEDRPGPVEAVAYTRNWSPAPPLPAGAMPDMDFFRQRYGGDPVSIHLHNREHPERLFIGGIDIQEEARPLVDAVLNLSENPSRWVVDEQIDGRDRWATKGEGPIGMTVEDIRAEAEWVVERLRAGQRVLVHCSAGMNRSVTIGCAALMMLEGLSAEDALARIHQNRPWARPDSHHWLALRWLAEEMG
ncbi:MAG: dual specificity protein phosphatase family protein [Anaerolineales bacterium]|nr:dual specificity protein phosphatase family protein [Anaerolineales bacterium]